MMFWNEKEGWVFLAFRQIYDKCLDKTFNDCEIGTLLPELYRVVEYYDYKSDFFDNQKGLLISELIQVFRKINKNNKGEYINEVIDFLLNGKVDSFTFPKYLYSICFPEEEEQDEILRSLLSSIKIDSKDLDNKEYHHPFLKMTNIYKSYREKYLHTFDDPLEMMFYLHQHSHTVTYFLKNNIDPNKLEIVLDFIINNVSALYSYYEVNGGSSYKKELRNKILEKSINNSLINKKTIN